MKAHAGQINGCETGPAAYRRAVADAWLRQSGCVSVVGPSAGSKRAAATVSGRPSYSLAELQRSASRGVGTVPTLARAASGASGAADHYSLRRGDDFLRPAAPLLATGLRDAYTTWAGSHCSQRVGGAWLHSAEAPPDVRDRGHDCSAASAATHAVAASAKQATGRHAVCRGRAALRAGYANHDYVNTAGASALVWRIT